MKHPQYINVDLKAIVATAHQCSGCFTAKACCCAKYEVCVGLREMRTIIGALPLAAEYCPWLKTRTGYENVFDETERGLFAIDTHDDGLCVFAYHCDSGIRCSLHTAAVQIGTSPHLVKPYACTLWPLVMREPPYAALSICDDAFRFPCNRTSRKKDDVISPEILYSIEMLLGADACAKIVKAASKGLRRTRVPLHGVLVDER
jgi:hypothetical protein